MDVHFDQDRSNIALTCAICQVKGRRLTFTEEGLELLLSGARPAWPAPDPSHLPAREFFIDNLLVRVHFIVVMIRWTGLAPWLFEFPFPGSLTSTFLADPSHLPRQGTREKCLSLILRGINFSRRINFKRTNLVRQGLFPPQTAT